MAAATEGYVNARTDAVQARNETSIAEAFLRVERSILNQTRWLLGVISLLITLIAIGVSIALALAGP